MPGWTGHRPGEHRRKCGWSWRSGQPTSGRDRPMARNGYSATWRSMAFGWASVASSVSERSLAYAAGRRGDSKATTDSGHRLPVADNILGQQFKVWRPNTVWVSDITYIPTDEGWLYLAGHKDLFTGEIVGYAMGERMTKNLVSQSLFRALRAKRPARGLMHHSDRGSQYCSQEYRGLLERSGLRSSMSGKGNCFDNAPMESFWGTLKQELVHHRHYRSRQEGSSRDHGIYRALL